MHAAASLTDEKFRALADPVRRDILRMVGRRDTSAGRISARFDITRPAVSRHLKVLRNAELVTVRQDGTTRYYRANKQALVDLGQFFTQFWDEGLPRLKTLAEAEVKDAKH